MCLAPIDADFVLLLQRVHCARFLLFFRLILWQIMWKRKVVFSEQVHMTSSFDESLKFIFLDVNARSQAERGVISFPGWGLHQANLFYCQ